MPCLIFKNTPPLDTLHLRLQTLTVRPQRPPHLAQMLQKPRNHFLQALLVGGVELSSDQEASSFPLLVPMLPWDLPATHRICSCPGNKDKVRAGLAGVEAPRRGENGWSVFGETGSLPGLTWRQGQ